MPKLKAGTILPTDEEDAVITAAAMSDPDAIPLTDAEWERIKPTVRRGRPPAAETKERITIRLSSDVLRAFRESGPGWQTRINAALLEGLQTFGRVEDWVMPTKTDQVKPKRAKSLAAGRSSTRSSARKPVRTAVRAKARG